MKAARLLAMGLILSLGMQAQTFVNAAGEAIAHDLQIFSEDGHKFVLRVNGQQVNKEASSSVQLATYNDNVLVQVDFVDPTLPDIERKHVMVAFGNNDIPSAQSTVYRLKEKKGKYKFRMVSNSDKMAAMQQVIYVN